MYKSDVVSLCRAKVHDLSWEKRRKGVEGEGRERGRGGRHLKMASRHNLGRSSALRSIKTQANALLSIVSVWIGSFPSGNIGRVTSQFSFASLS